ncbi:T9SS type A sorting domain-containing protein [Crocinitomix catalasitica]|nr:T9SS type A sorting domain-containing protein [Crocinitomix catalasitica]
MKNILLAILFLGINTGWAQSPGNSLDFDGSNDYVSAALPTVFNDISSNDFTIEAWIKPNGSAFCRVVFAQLNSTNFASLSLSTTNQIYFYVNNVTGEATTATLPTGIWSHVACVWDASTGLTQTYINGILAATSDGGSSSLGVDNLMTIGTKTDGTQPFTGELDELRIWDDIRTECEILGAMNSEFTVAQTNLVAYYNFNQGTAGGTNTGITTLPDFTTSYDGTLNNFALTGAASNWLASAAVINEVNATSGYSTTDVQSTCDSITWIDGITYTASNNTATFTLTAADGCDSTVTLDLIVNGPAISVTQTGSTLTADEAGATYQWLDCPAMTPIVGATSQVYTATANGDYAVIITNGGCTDTSTCYTVTGVSVIENDFGNELLVYPNPTDGNFSIDLGENYQTVSITMTDLSGKEILSKTYKEGQLLNLKIDEPVGVYLLIIESGNKKAVIRLVKE